MKTGLKGLAIIKESEGLSTVAYKDSVGVLTIGYGHTGNVKEGDKITVEIANQLLQTDLLNAERYLNKLGLPLNQNQYDACISFIFNLGFGRFSKSTLLKKIEVNENDPNIAGEFKKWVFGTVGGESLPLAGLITRRQKEADLYFTKI